MFNDKNFNEIIVKVNDYIQMLNSEATGPIGEIVAQLLLLKAFDHAKKVTNSEACTVKEFLISLLGNVIFNVSNDILNGIVFCNHFIERLKDFSYDDVVAHYVARGAAGKFKPRQPAYDLFIPIVLENNALTYMLIQVKNQEVFKNRMAEDVFQEMAQPDKNWFENQSIIPFLSIIMSLGDEKPRDPKEAQNQVFYSLRNLENCKFYSSNTITSLKMLLNCGKFDSFSKKFDLDVIKRVMIGSI